MARFTRLDPESRHDDDGPLTYLCLGRADGPHLVHMIDGRPNWDNVLAVRLVPGTVRHHPGPGGPAGPPAADFDEPVPVTFARPDTPERRLVAGDTAEGSFSLGFSRAGERGFTARVEVIREIYLEVGELA